MLLNHSRVSLRPLRFSKGESFTFQRKIWHREAGDTLAEWCGSAQDSFSLKEHLLCASLSGEKAGGRVRIGCYKIPVMRYSSCL